MLEGNSGQEISDNLTLPLKPKQADEVMNYLLDYYIKLHTIVKSKISHADIATKEKIAELEASDCTQSEKDIVKYKELESLWNKILEVLSSPSITTETLEMIQESEEDIMPDGIKQRYDELVTLDQKLLTLIEEVNSDQYRVLYSRAKKLTDKIQSTNDLMSSLPPSEFDGHFRMLAEKEAKSKPLPSDSEDERQRGAIGTIKLPNGRIARVLD